MLGLLSDLREAKKRKILLRNLQYVESRTGVELEGRR